MRLTLMLATVAKAPTTMEGPPVADDFPIWEALVDCDKPPIECGEYRDAITTFVVAPGGARLPR